MIILINWQFLKKQHKDTIILIKIISTTVRNFDNNKKNVKEFTKITLNILVKLNEKPVLLRLSCEAYVVNNLSANMLIGANILGFYGIVINIAKSQATVKSCQNAVINLRVKPKVNYLTRPIYNKQRIIIPPKSKVKLPIKLIAKHTLLED